MSAPVRKDSDIITRFFEIPQCDLSDFARQSMDVMGLIIKQMTKLEESVSVIRRSMFDVDVIALRDRVTKLEVEKINLQREIDQLKPTHAPHPDRIVLPSERYMGLSAEEVTFVRTMMSRKTLPQRVGGIAKDILMFVPLLVVNGFYWVASAKIFVRTPSDPKPTSTPSLITQR